VAAPRSFEQFLLEGSAYIVTKFQRDGKQGPFLNIDLEHASKHLIDYPDQKIATQAIAIALKRLYNQDLSREKWAELLEAYRGWF
jgi:Tfp pilus assembly protein PilN